MLEKYGLEAQVIAETDEPSLSEDVKLLLFESVRELLLNVVKHAGTKAARVHLTKSGDQLRIMVSDKGRGFDIERLLTGPNNSTGGFGLFSIRERIQLIGGTFEAYSSPNKGSRSTINGSVGEPHPS